MSNEQSAADVGQKTGVEVEHIDGATDVMRTIDQGYTAGQIKAGPLTGHYVLDDVRSGLTIHQDGPNIALSAGTINHDQSETELYTYHAITPNQAREIAEMLNHVADEAEEILQSEDQSEKQGQENFIRRLLP